MSKLLEVALLQTVHLQTAGGSSHLFDFVLHSSCCDKAYNFTFAEIATLQLLPSYR